MAQQLIGFIGAGNMATSLTGGMVAKGIRPARIWMSDPSPDRLDEVPADGTFYVICAKGGRSMAAAEFLRGEGRDAVNVAGGTTAWVDAGLPTESGSPA